ncbi:MAG: alpha/beta hydrolase [Bryobacterales bacterium]|nr:alpha/beta hydrolase [Bryobacterales bacterium]
MLTRLAALVLAAAAWSDPSPHQVRMVTVEPGVQLEVLDWGGTGRPVVLLAGYLSAHAYDDLAPRLAETHHVYGISRRGYGASSQPETGYTAARSADDVLQVLEVLNLRGVILAGHSWGGQDLSTIGARGAERVAALVYINSAEDPTLTMADYEMPKGQAEPPPRPLPPAPDLSSPAAYRAWQMKAHGIAFPEAELRQAVTVREDGSLGANRTPKRIRDAIFAGRAKPEYSEIRMPVVALFATGGGHGAAYDAVGKRHREDLRNGVPHARVVEVPGANFYLFSSHPEIVIREIRALTTLR